jgi:predicted dehydrogenase
MTGDREIRLGFVGVGTMGQAAHLRNYATLNDCRVVALAEKRPKLAAEVARRFGVDRVYDSFEGLLEREDLDGIVAIQQFQMHGQYVPELLKKGVPVLTEKPLASTVEDGEAIVRAVNASSAPLFLAYHKRCDPAMTYAKETMSRWDASGEMGALRYIRITMPPGDWSAQAFASNVSTDELFDLGVAFGMGGDYEAFVNYYIHQVNLFRFLFSRDFEVLYADPSGITMTLRSAHGMIGVLEMAPYSTSMGWQESVLICYEKGWIRVDLPAPLVIDQPGEVFVYRDSSTGPILLSPTLQPWHAMRKQAANFLAAIRGEPHSLCGAEDGLKDLLIARAYIRKLGDSRSLGR